jgi:site-specific recombinase XerD
MAIPAVRTNPFPSRLARFRPLVDSYLPVLRAENTLQSYESLEKHFSDWCFEQRVESLPASGDTVTAYLSVCAASEKPNAGTIQCRLNAIAARHLTNGFPSPTTESNVKLIMASIRSKLGTAQKGKEPLFTEQIAAMVRTLPKRPSLGWQNSLCDRALLLIGFAGALRRSELTSLNVEDIEFHPADGLLLRIRKSKSKTEQVGIDYGGMLCPVSALVAWLQVSAIAAGPVFPARRIGTEALSSQTLARLVKRYMEAAGLDSANYSAASLRNGFIAQAAINGIPERVIMKQARLKSSESLRKYVKDPSLFSGNVSMRLGL